MPRRQKVSVVLVFATGGFVIASAIYRTVILPTLLTDIDYTWRRRNGDMVARGFELTSKSAGPNGSALSLSNDEIALWTQTGKAAQGAQGPAGSEDLVAPWREQSDEENRKDKFGWGRNINIAATEYDESSHKVCNGRILVDHETTVTYGTHK
ncbi:hypothetical protein N0V82_009709 [Gnomoniopsis sp. IMI 355080]|nr:hypothetical protein N0V82_009709 [Gnomoniopsis sp. IMI 355080]